MDLRSTSRLLLPALLCLVMFYPCSARSAGYKLPKGVNGGVGCVTCTAIVALTEQLSVIHNETFVVAYDRLCNVLPTSFRNACISLGDFYIPKIVDILTKEITADVVCHAIKLCYTEKGQPTCHAFPPKGSGEKDFDFAVDSIRRNIARKGSKAENENDFRFRHSSSFDPCLLPGVKDICKLFENVFANDEPLVDLDLDSFSAVVESWRGTSWRGKDCDDWNAMFHPGARPVDSDVVFDSNCNGIHGVDPDTGRPYEDLLCGGNLSDIMQCPKTI